MRRRLPAGTVTFLFTDVEGSTRLLHELGAEDYAVALAEHRRISRAAFAAHGGVEVDTQGDAFFVAFPTAAGALEAADAIRAGLEPTLIRVRMGVHTGTPLVTDEGYVGDDVHRAARIAACGRGGQILVSSSTAALVDAARLHDLGEHRLKDLSAAERIYQLGTDTFPALESLYRTNLPIPATPFLGRETELTGVCDLLRRDHVRLLTLTGPGGTGKTRLALQSAGALANHFPDGVYWVPLAPLRDPQLVLQSAAQAVGAEDGFVEHVADKRLLLLFDNFEHLTEAATDAASLLGRCPNLHLLVTSREPLHVGGEQEYPVPPLAHEEAVDFFTAKARAIRPDFEADEAVPAICNRLDDLPLALELAAARVKALTPTRILARLDQRLPLLTGGDRDAPERQRTLRATIDWSHDLLTDDEQRLYSRLAVFRGGCTLEAAEEIADADLDTLQSLVDKSLVRHNEGRYWMLETIREHAGEKLEASGEAGEALRRHALHFLSLAEEADPYLREVALRGGHHQSDWLDRLEAEHDNLRAALDWLEAAGETQFVLRIAGALFGFWFENSHFVELRTRLVAAVKADHRPTAARAKALIGAGDILSISDDDAGATRSAVDALAIYRTLDDRSGSADALHRLGVSATERGECEAALPLLEEARKLFEETDDRDAVLNVTRSLGWTYERLGDRERARQLYSGNLAEARAIDNTFIASASAGALATFAAEEGRADEARALAREHLSGARDFGKLELSTSLSRAAYVLAHTGDAEVAATVLGCAQAIADEIGAIWEWVREMNTKTSNLARTHLGEQAFATSSERGRRFTIHEAVPLALDALD